MGHDDAKIEAMMEGYPREARALELSNFCLAS